MSNTIIHKTSIGGLYVLDGLTNQDGRGFFREVFRMEQLSKILNFDFTVAQMNHSYSNPGVLRGLHGENWNKLVYPVTGKFFAAIVDIRPESLTFAKVETFIIDGVNRKALFISKGLANSICVMGTEGVHYMYLVDAYYDGTDTKAIAWDDTDLKIDWPLKNPILSERDKHNPTLRELFPDKNF